MDPVYSQDLPTGWVCFVFIVLFGLSTLTHLVQCIYTRTWWLLSTAVLSGLFATLGWTSRLLVAQTIGGESPYDIQRTSLVVAPVLLLIACFIIFARLIGWLGSSYSRFSPNLYSIVFSVTASLALVIQSIGTILVANKQPSGTKVITAGMIILAVTILAFSACVLEYFVRYTQEIPLPTAKKFDRGTWSLRIQILTCALCFVLIVQFIRVVYRATDSIQEATFSELHFNVLDGAMVLLGSIALNIAHPGFLLRQDYAPVEADVEKEYAQFANAAAQYD